MTPEDLNKLRRNLDLIEANAKQADHASPWELDHDNVVVRRFQKDKDGKPIRRENGILVDLSYDVASFPWERRRAVHGTHQENGPKNMRHIATCNPKRMLELVALIREILP